MIPKAVSVQYSLEASTIIPMPMPRADPKLNMDTAKMFIQILAFSTDMSSAPRQNATTSLWDATAPNSSKTW